MRGVLRTHLNGAAGFPCAFTPSMQPWIRSKDIALIRRISIENVRCGDVVLFRRENIVRAPHCRERLLMRATSFKGDAHPTSMASFKNRNYWAA